MRLRISADLQFNQVERPWGILNITSLFLAEEVIVIRFLKTIDVVKQLTELNLKVLVNLLDLGQTPRNTVVQLVT